MKLFTQKTLPCFVITLLMMSIPFALQAQEIMPFAGSITDENKNPLAGVTVIQKGNGHSTTSDENGNYSIMVETRAVLVFIRPGFETIEVPAHKISSATIMRPARSGKFKNNFAGKERQQSAKRTTS